MYELNLVAYQELLQCGKSLSSGPFRFGFFHMEYIFQVNLREYKDQLLDVLLKLSGSILLSHSGDLIGLFSSLIQ